MQREGIPFENLIFSTIKWELKPPYVITITIEMAQKARSETPFLDPVLTLAIRA